MCCLFGVLDYNHSFNKRQMNRLLTVLSTACEARGTDATGIAYNYNGKLKSAEILLKEDGSFQMIRRAETPKDYFATFDCFPVFEKLLQDEDELK